VTGAIALCLVLVLAGCGSDPDRDTPTAAPSSGASQATAPKRTPPSTVTTTTVPPTTTTTVAPLPAPPPLAPLATTPMAGEAVWQADASSAVPGGYAIYTAQMRPADGFPAVGVARIDTKAARLVLYAGTAEPYGTWPQQGAIPASLQTFLLAAFNSGFKMYSYRTGWYDQGRDAVSLQTGAASLVIFADGTATVGEWGRDVALNPNVQAVRQNLTLLVDHGAPAASVSIISAWGATLGRVTYTWRSGIGVTRTGELVYVGGPSLDPASLARVLIAAGAVRAMELDINPEWVSFATYTHTGPAITSEGSLVPGTYYGPARYLQADSRDFFAVYSR
jgi:hypothetical protein